jgi:pimeloyl-ACP methyl ester carboxylesterase
VSAALAQFHAKGNADGSFGSIGLDAMARLLAVCCAVLLLVPADAGAVSHRGATPTRGDFAGRVSIGGGRQLYLKCRGMGRPTVMLEAGLRNTGDVWSAPAGEGDTRTMVYQGVSRFTRVCAYDRPGTTLPPNEVSRSSPVPMPRTTTDTAADLHRLLVAARLPGPFVLVGHSTGGLIVRRFAAAHPRDVAGLVEVDAIAEGIQPLLEPDWWPLYNEHALIEAPPEIASYPDLETIAFEASFAQMRQAEAKSPLRPVPLVVLSHRKPFDLPATLPPDFSPILERAWRTIQDQLAHLVPGAQHVIATHSGHYIQIDQPGLVRAAIKRVVNAVRAGRRTAIPQPR